MRNRNDRIPTDDTRPAMWTIAAVCAVGALLVVGAIVLTDGALRKALLNEARSIAASMDPERIASLARERRFSGNADFVRLLEQISAIRPSYEGCIRLSLLGLVESRPVVLVDATTDDVTPKLSDSPFTTLPDEALRVFRTEEPFFGGPLVRSDRRFVSVLVPIRNPHDGMIPGVLNVEIAAEHWMWNLVAHSALPVALAILLSILVLAELTAFRMALSLRHEQERFRRFFYASPDAYLILENGVFTECNDAALSFLRATRDEVIGALPSDFSPLLQPDGAPSLSMGREWAKEAALNGIARFEWLHRRKDASEVLTDVFLVALSGTRKKRFMVHWRELPGCPGDGRAIR